MAMGMEAALQVALGDLHLPQRVHAGCAQHWALMLRWNARTNLTAVTDPEKAAWVHYRDSLAALSLLHHGPVVDFGSGAGFPGIPLALALPDHAFTLVEPRRKRASFLRHAVAQLELKSVQVLAGRLQDPPPGVFAHAVTRATFSDDATLAAAARWLQPGGTLVAYRSERPASSAVSVLPYTLQGETRHLEIWRFAAP